MKRQHTIIGAGQVGTQLARQLSERGERVRLVRRSVPGAAIPGVTWMQGDINDRAFADEACRDAAIRDLCDAPEAFAGEVRDWNAFHDYWIRTTDESDAPTLLPGSQKGASLSLPTQSVSRARRPIWQTS